MDTHYKRLIEALLMSTHNICFRGEIRKNANTVCAGGGGGGGRGWAGGVTWG